MDRRMKELSIVLLIFLVIFALGKVAAQPAGAQITYNATETKTPAAADSLNTSGGTFTTIILNSTTQNLKWKAYAGNVTGVLTLDDSGDYSIFQWQQTTFTGEVYSSRNNSISWPNIRCANLTNIQAENTAMNHTGNSVDSINNTFSSTIHRGFFAGNVQITQSTCRSAFTWANDTAQAPSIDAPYQEVLLHDGTNLVYTTFIDDNTLGFNFNRYDFQMIVAERGVGGETATRYYFYMELQ